MSIYQEADKLARHLLYSLDEKSCTIELPDKTYYIERPVRPHETTPEDYIGKGSQTDYEAGEDEPPTHIGAVVLENLPDSAGAGEVDPRAKWMFDGSGVPQEFDEDGTITVDKLGRKVPNCS